MREAIKKTVVLEAYVQTSYDTYSHIFRNVEIEIPDDGNEWHVCGEMKEADMKGLEKILEEIKNERESYEAVHVKSYEKGLRFAAEAIRKHMADDWIPVEERLPEVGENVLGTNKYNEVLVYHYGWNSPHTRKMFFHLFGAAADIIAWRPLPKPYQPKSN